MSQRKDKDITAITVVYNTADLFLRAYKSVRLFHPTMSILVIDGSDIKECSQFIRSFSSDYTSIISIGYNIGHGKGMDKGIRMVRTKYAMLFDTDIVMLKSPVEQMLQMMSDESFGIGWVTEIGRDGYDFGTFGHHKEPIKYLHPYFHIINVENYKKYKPYCHHGAPCFKTALDLHDQGKSHLLLQFPGLTGHTTGRGANWTGAPSEFIQHDFGGTRLHNKKSIRLEIPGKWEF
jgi:hypothetical protein